MTDTPAARGKLYVVGTPIGNLDDLTPRARDVLATADVIAAEDTRHTRGLLSRIGVEARLIAYHEHNEEKRVPELLERLAGGETVALVSDAGTPLISDPGWRLVRAARERASTSCPCPGPSAAIVALCAAGLPTDRFVFEGFLPRRDGARARTPARARTRTAHARVLRSRASRRGDAGGARRSTSAPIGGPRSRASSRRSTSRSSSGTLAELARGSARDIPLLGEFVIVVAGDRASAPDATRRARLRAPRRRARPRQGAAAHGHAHGRLAQRAL